ncbi:MAG: hypothetical protein HY507_01860 [Candidatus Zambryskibacteria bacterium]|nr:hypothetical protein [Candidatus Zambryskibacteria bacterium]
MNPTLLRYGGLGLAFLAGIGVVSSSGNLFKGAEQTCSSVLERPCFEQQTGKKLMQLSQKQGIQMLGACLRSSSKSQRGETTENTKVCADEKITFCNEGASGVVVKEYGGNCKTVPPVVVTFPNGGETLMQFVVPTYTVTWSGGWHRIAAYLVKPEATNNSDPSKLILGSIGASPYEVDPLGAELLATTMSLPWDGGSVANLDPGGDWVMWEGVPPGNYKILILSENDKGEMLLWDGVNNKPGNWDVSDQPFTMVGN